MAHVTFWQGEFSFSLVSESSQEAKEMFERARAAMEKCGLHVERAFLSPMLDYEAAREKFFTEPIR